LIDILLGFLRAHAQDRTLPEAVRVKDSVESVQVAEAKGRIMLLLRCRVIIVKIAMIAIIMARE